MELAKQAIDAAYQAEVTNLYKALSDALLMAQTDTSKQDSAKDKFRRGLERAHSVYNTALSISGANIK